MAGTLLGGGGGVGVFALGGPGRGEAGPARGDTVGGAEATEDAAELEALGLASADMFTASGYSFQPSVFETAFKVLWRLQHCVHLLESSQPQPLRLLRRPQLSTESLTFLGARCSASAALPPAY